MIRQPIVAGQFYPATPEALSRQVRGYLRASDSGNRPDMLVMAPHAGYMYSGRVAGETLAQAQIAENVLLMGPNHTGRGARLSMWSQGAWNIPGHSVPVIEDLARAFLDAEPRLRSDTQAHQYEHSLEVMLPFLVERQPKLGVVPLTVSENDPGILTEVGKAMAAVLRGWESPVTIVVSSDMSHYLPHDETKYRDRMALDKIQALDPLGLYQVVRRNNITMCGVLPMTLGLLICRELGAREVRITDYDTSGTASGDFSKVVGYAGVIVS